jgi:ABC-type Fe3+/spermidine/putrescine transport system ATPase subunit
MLSISGLCVHHNRQPILNELSLDLCDGETLAIMGPSGCGKTTLLKAIAGFIDEIAGEINYRGAIWQDAQNKVDPSKRAAALLFQEQAIWPHLTVEQHLDLLGPDNALLIERLGLKAQTLGRALSGGEKQRLALGRVLKTKAPLLLLDEPFAALDRVTKTHTIQLLLEHQKSRKCGILLATHDLKDAEQLGARVLKLIGC